MANNYGLRMEYNFADVFDTKNNEANDEIIFAILFWKVNKQTH